jgi:hypothetical protein
MTAQDPVTEYAQQRRQAREDLATSLTLGQAVADEQQDATEQTAPLIESLTAGGNPSGYTPPTTNDEFREWAREATYRHGGPEYPPAA